MERVDVEASPSNFSEGFKSEGFKSPGIRALRTTPPVLPDLRPRRLRNSIVYHALISNVFLDLR